MKQKLKIGTIGYPVSQKLLFSHVDIIEITETRHSVPKPAVAKKLRESAPGHISFSVQVPRFFYETPAPDTTLGGDPGGYGGFQLTTESQRLFDKLNRFADGLDAAQLVLLTPSEFTPTEANRNALEAFVNAMPIGGRTLVWQPSGPWTDRQAAQLAKKLGMILATDPLRDEAPAGKAAYFRLGPFAAMGSRVGLYDLERLAAAAAPFEETAIVFETDRALDDVRNLKQVVEEMD